MIVFHQDVTQLVILVQEVLQINAKLVNQLKIEHYQDQHVYVVQDSLMMELILVHHVITLV